MLIFTNLEEAFQFVSAGPKHEYEAVLNRETGEIFYKSEAADVDEFPEDVENERFIAIPHKNDLNLGIHLIREFASEYCPSDLSEANNMFRRKGAYRRFKVFLETRGLLEKWYDYEDRKTKEELRRWCDDNEIELNDSFRDG